MKIKQVIEQLCSHEISKQQAIELITEITDSLRSKRAIGFYVEGIAFSSESNDAILNLRAPYYYDKIKGRIEIGDLVDVEILP
jgi:hypothetical protein